MNRRNNRRPALQKEKISIIAASVFVLSALTLAGVYMSAQGDVENEENRIDFAKLEQENITTKEEGSGLADTRFESQKSQAEIPGTEKALGDTRFVDEDPYDLICLDIMMPVMDGYQALMGIRNLEKQKNIPQEKAVKVIMTTALNDEANVKMAFELGCTIYSGKPIDQDRFEQALKKLNLI